jgi:hypothetical protein
MAEALTIVHGLPLKVRPERFVVVTDIGHDDDTFTAATLHKNRDGAYLDVAAPTQARDVIRPVGEAFSPAEVLELAVRGAKVRGTELSEAEKRRLTQSAAKGARTIVRGH